MPEASLVVPPTLPPALQRRLRHVAAVKAMRARAGVATLGCMLVAGLGVSIPATAQPETSAPHAEAEAAAPQSLTITAVPQAPAPVRDGYTAVLPPQLQYPVALGSAVASGYGPRSCAGCNSNFHQGIDIFPGAGTPIHAIANGAVSRAVPVTGDSMGVMVVIDHVVGGEAVTSVYGHIQDGTMTLTEGQQVAAGDVIGLVGATGNAQGAHLHFEIHPGGGDSVNPYEWLAARIG